MKNGELIGFKSHVKGKKLSMTLKEFSDFVEIPLGGLDIFHRSASAADFGFPPPAIQQKLYLDPATPITETEASDFRLPVRVANRILSTNLLNKAGNRDDIYETARAILVCLFRKTKIDWVRFILQTMAKPSLKSLPYSSHISNLLLTKNISTGNWELITPSVTPINMSAVNRMLVAGTIETLRVMLLLDPPPVNLEYTENVVAKLLKAKQQLIELEKDVDHIPDYKVTTKRQTRKPSTSSQPSRPSSTPSSPPHSSAPPPPRRETREDRVLDAIAQLSLQQQSFAEYNFNCFTQIHREHEFLSKKLDDSYHSLECMYTFSSIPPPPPPLDGFPFTWPPAGYSTIFPSRQAADIPQSISADPSGAADVAGTSGDPDAGPSSAAGDVSAGVASAGDVPTGDDAIVQ